MRILLILTLLSGPSAMVPSASPFLTEALAPASVSGRMDLLPRTKGRQWLISAWRKIYFQMLVARLPDLLWQSGRREGRGADFLSDLSERVVDSRWSPWRVSRLIALIDSHLLSCPSEVSSPWRQTLPTFADWLVRTASNNDDEEALLLQRVRAIARYTPRGAAFLFSSLGPHLRADFDAGDERYDLALYPILLRGFAPYLKSLLEARPRSPDESKRIEWEIERYGMALWSGLMIPPRKGRRGSEPSLSIYTHRFNRWTQELGPEINLPDLVAQVRERLHDQLPFKGPPETLTWKGHRLLSSEILRIVEESKWRMNFLSAFEIMTGDSRGQEYRVEATSEADAYERAEYVELGAGEELYGWPDEMITVYHFLYTQKSTIPPSHGRRSTSQLLKAA